MNCTYCEMPLGRDASFCTSCGAAVDRSAVATDTGPPTAAQISIEPDPWFGHLLRMIGVSTAMAISVYACFAGLFWNAHALSRTGYRRRDLLLFLVPIVGNIVQIRSAWRYTARSVYWTPRDDRASDVLRGWQRPASIALGWVALPLIIVGSAVIAVTTDGWSEQLRQDEIDSIVDAGYTEEQARCLVREVESDVPDYYGASDGEFDAAFEAAFDTCVGPR